MQRHADLYLSLLLKELSGSFGLHIISADLRRVLLSTGLVDAAAAQQLLQQALQQMQQHPLFDSVVVSPSDCFLAVLQLDAKDWVGYREFVPFEESSSSSNSNNNDGEGVRDSLGALRCLPRPLASFLRATIDRVLQLPLLQLLHELNAYADDFSPDDSRSSSSSSSSSSSVGGRSLTKDEIATKLSELAVRLWFTPGGEEGGPPDGKENQGGPQGAPRHKKPKTFFERLKLYIKDPIELIRSTPLGFRV